VQDVTLRTELEIAAEHASETALRAALAVLRGSGDDGAFVAAVLRDRRYDPVFQPIADLRTGRVVGVEALARFRSDPPMPPAAVLRMAERVGRRAELEIALLAAAVAAADGVPEGVYVAVHLSPEAALDPALPDVLTDAQCPRVVLELTDHRTVADYAQLAEALAPLREAGLRVAVDDSGEGLASLRHMAALAPDLLKLDRSLTRGVDADGTRRALAHVFVEVAEQLGTAVVAEGLETRGELETLRGFGIPYGQGYLLARPAPLATHGDLRRPLALPSVAERADAPPVLDLPGRAREDVREASRMALRWLARELPGSATVATHHLDHGLRELTVLTARGPLAEAMPPGASFPLDHVPDPLMVAGRGERLCGDLPLDPVYGGLAVPARHGVLSWLGVPLTLPCGATLGSVVACSGERDAFDGAALEAAEAAARAIAVAAAAETAGLSRVRRAEHLRRLARTDELTGVLNMSGLEQQVAAELRLARRDGGGGRWYARVQIEDLDSLYQAHGRTVGDLVVKDVAAAMALVANPGEVVGRAGTAHLGALLVGRHSERGVEAFWTALLARAGDALAKRRVRADLRVAAVPFEAGSTAAALADAAGARLRPLAEL
jgi:EAL domain-containing protein (putative c-di-GMP-specific phosphodiesterase class I)/GGDEF domain-containing protein